MKFFATIALAATAAVAQQIGSNGGPSVSDGEAAVSHPNINNGLQLQNSLADSSDKGGNFFHNLEGNTFTDALSNTGISDNNMVNPSNNHVSGNSGATTNGEGNQIGDIVHGLAGFGGFGGQFRRRAIHRRDAVVNNFDHSAAWGHPAQGVPVFAPVVGFPARPHPGFAGPGAHVNHNVQDAAIVQNQNRH
ncbi:hypothetical protein LPJ58_006032 [Coemansia sp. RSA 1591]|nr:hypothetical protein LPJ58_006032 [Coemansia sp. RSA 1591]KAJ1749464.1 hypothetical protein LPJ69_006021 [Coemansia sp. RSA 1752]KAJ1779904.1 hypothetical protein LPJ67_005903 [Coemansia sp. RSA 1938]KAJ2251963.1 hypothetical protein GGH98_003145 [Coemansia sp. RSA 454]KAJ2444129.1 hypothetical protein IWW46_002186 [Coemansia sp. RSA 2440]